VAACAGSKIKDVEWIALSFRVLSVFVEAAEIFCSWAASEDVIVVNIGPGFGDWRWWFMAGGGLWRVVVYGGWWFMAGSKRLQKIHLESVCVTNTTKTGIRVLRPTATRVISCV
jgi:hypothetical protein